MDVLDEESIRKAIENGKQSVNTFHEACPKAEGKDASKSTSKRLLSVLAQDISE